MFGCYCLDACSLLKRERKEVGDGRGVGKELGGVRRWGTAMRIYCLRSESVFNKERNMYPDICLINTI